MSLVGRIRRGWGQVAGSGLRRWCAAVVSLAVLVTACSADDECLPTTIEVDDVVVEQSTDPVVLTARLRTATGTPVAGVRVDFALTRERPDGTLTYGGPAGRLATGANGVAETTLQGGVAAHSTPTARLHSYEAVYTPVETDEDDTRYCQSRSEPGLITVRQG